MLCDAINGTGDITLIFPRLQNTVLKVSRVHVARSSVLSTMVSSAAEQVRLRDCETSFTAPEGYVQAWAELVQDDTMQLLGTEELGPLLALLKVRVSRTQRA